MTLYELTGAYLNVQRALYDPDFDKESAEEFLADIDDALEDKADAYAKILKQMAADVDTLSDEIARLQARKAQLADRADWLKRNLKGAMEMTGKTKFKTPLFSFSIASNPASVVLDAPLDRIPEGYLIPQDPKVNKKAIGDAIKNGADLSGIAHLEQGTRLSIR